MDFKPQSYYNAFFSCLIKVVDERIKNADERHFERSSAFFIRSSVY